MRSTKLLFKSISSLQKISLMKYLIIIISLAAVLCACNSQTNQTESETKLSNENLVELTDAQLKNINLDTTSLQTKDITSVIRLNGKIDVPPQNMVSVSAPLGGYLKSTELLPGMRINKGDVIAVMEDQQYIQLQQDYLLTKSKLHYAELEYQRQRDLNNSQASSDKITQQAEAELNNQKINLNALAQKLRLININPQKLTVNNISKTINLYSSITGFVSQVNVNIGKYVNPTEVLFELVNPLDIHLNLKVYEKDLNKLSIGQKVVAYTNNQPEKKFECEIILISKDISIDGVAEVHCHFETYDKSLFPGTYMNAEVNLKSNLSFALPQESIVSFEGKDYVFVANNNHQFIMTNVNLGTAENGFVTILNAQILKNKTIVSNGSYTLLMKLKNNEEEE
jgi:cobalt-zinc-cadmium efflux system membrane fusion protein